MTSVTAPPRTNSQVNRNSGEASNDITEQQVVSFLKKTPEFFRQNPEILANMSVPHGSGNAVSLVERQVAILRERSMQARHKMSELVDNAKDNDDLFNKTQALVVDLLKASTIDELFEITHTHFSDYFSVERTSILIIAPALETLAGEISQPFIRSEAHAQEKIASVLCADATLCGVLRDTESEFLFSSSNEVGSAAVATCEINTDTPSTLILAVAHKNTDHYNQHTGTLFIDYIAQFLQIKIDQLIKKNANPETGQ